MIWQDFVSLDCIVLMDLSFAVAEENKVKHWFSNWLIFPSFSIDILDFSAGFLSLVE